MHRRSPPREYSPPPTDYYGGREREDIPRIRVIPRSRSRSPPRPYIPVRRRSLSPGPGPLPRGRSRSPPDGHDRDRSYGRYPPPSRVYEDSHPSHSHSHSQGYGESERYSDAPVYGERERPYEPRAYKPRYDDRAERAYPPRRRSPEPEFRERRYDDRGPPPPRPTAPRGAHYAPRGGGGGAYTPPARPSAPRQPYDRQPAPPSNVLGVFGLLPTTNDRSLRDYFAGYHPVDIKLILDRATGVHRGFAFVTFADIDTAMSVKESLGETPVIDGKSVRIDYSKTLKAHDPSPGQYLGRNPQSQSVGSSRPSYQQQPAHYQRDSRDSHESQHYGQSREARDSGDQYYGQSPAPRVADRRDKSDRHNDPHHGDRDQLAAGNHDDYRREPLSTNGHDEYREESWSSSV